MLKENGANLQDAIIRVTVIPQDSPAKIGGIRPVTDSWQVSVTLHSKQNRSVTDITHLLPGLTVQLDMESVAASLTAMKRYDEERFRNDYTVYAVSEDVSEDAGAALMIPWTKQEAETTGFPAMMYTHRYLSAPLMRSGVYTAAAK